MVDLYNAIADQNGISRTPNLLDADTVRSIPNIGIVFVEIPAMAVFNKSLFNK